MARHKKEEKLKHKNYITLKLTDIELACLEQSAEALNISRGRISSKSHFGKANDLQI